MCKMYGNGGINIRMDAWYEVEKKYSVKKLWPTAGLVYGIIMHRIIHNTHCRTLENVSQ